MQFSIAFFAFLAVLLPLYYIVPCRLRAWLLLAASVVFYAFSGVLSLCVLGALTLLTYAFGRAIGALLSRERSVLAAHRADGSWDKAERKAYHDKNRRRVRIVLLLGVLLDLAPLLFFRLSLPTRMGLGELLLPLGLSFVTLSAVGYLCDVAWERVACERRPWRLASFIFYFPQMWQGPINRYGELAPLLWTPHRADSRRISAGAVRVLWGCVKKLVIADTAAALTAQILARQSELGGAGMLLLIPFYTLRIYADFTGGMDVALGASAMLGVDLYENFDRPFSATSLADYWRRWHRSLGRFFTEYVYYPLSLCRPLAWLSRHGLRRAPLYVSLLLTWLLTGLWHGFSLNFAVWGLCNGLFMLLSRELAPLRAALGAKFGRVSRSRAWQGALCLGTLGVTGLFRTLDLNASVGMTLSLWLDMLSPASWRTLISAKTWHTLGLGGAQWVLLGLGVALMWAVGHATPRAADMGERLSVRIAARPWLCATLAALMVVAVLVFGRYGADYHAADFIYGQF